VKFPSINKAEGSGIVPCLYCGEAIDTAKAYQQVVGLRHRVRRPHEVALAQPTGRWACVHCVELMERGVHPLQMSMSL